MTRGGLNNDNIVIELFLEPVVGDFDFNVFSYREKKQKIQDIRKNVKDAIVVSEPLSFLIQSCFLDLICLTAHKTLVFISRP